MQAKKMPTIFTKKNICHDKIPWHFPDIGQMAKIPWQFPDLEKILFFPDFSLTRGNPDLLHTIKRWPFNNTYYILPVWFE